MPIEILATVIGVGAAILGYAFREFRNRSRPFFHITKIDGTIIRRPDRVVMTQEIRRNLQGTFYIGNLSTNPELGEVGTSWDRADDVKRFWPDVEAKIKEVLDAAADDDIVARLSEAFKMVFFEKMLMYCLVIDKLTLKLTLANDAPEVIPIYDEDEYEGSVWICFPERARQFGNHLKAPAIRAKCQPFLDIIRHFDKDALNSTLKSLLVAMNEEYKAALKIEQPLKYIRDENSRWVFYAYFANLSNYPMIIDREDFLVVCDPTSKPFKEDCYLAVVKDNSIVDTNTPIVVKPGEDANICFITDRIQKDMPLGTAVRESYNRGQASCRIRIKLRKIGLVKTQRVWSSKTKFRGKGQKKDAPDGS